MKRKFQVGMICMLTISTLLFAGCAKGSKEVNNLKGVSNKQQTSTIANTDGNSNINSEAKSITDIELLNSSKEDSSAELDPLDTETNGLSSEELDLLLNDSSEINNIPTNFSAK